MKCRLCDNEFTQQKRVLVKPENHIHAMCQVMGSIIFDDVCQNEGCQNHANHEADEFDRMRKGE